MRNQVISRFSPFKPPGIYNYLIEYGCKFPAENTPRINWDPADWLGGNRQTWTFSTWYKRSKEISGRQELFGVYFNNDAWGHMGFLNSQLSLFWYSGTILQQQFETVALFRDVSQWYHIMFVMDTPQAAPLDRTKVYVNGVLQELSVHTQVSQNATPLWNAGDSWHRLSMNPYGGGNAYYLDGRQAETHWIDGQALTPDAFGELNQGIWIPKRYRGGYTGVTDFFMDYSNPANLGEDQSGKGNNSTDTNNLTTDDQIVDTPTNNHATLNFYDRWSNVNISNTGLRTQQASGQTSYQFAKATVPFPQSGKWYFENVFISGATNILNGGMLNQNAPLSTTGAPIPLPAGYIVYRGITNAFEVNGVSYPNYLSPPVTGNFPVIGFIVDMDNRQIALQTDQGSTGAFVPLGGSDDEEWWAASNTYLNYVYENNFGERPFATAPPEDFLPLNVFSLPEPAIMNPKQGFDIADYVGNGVEQVISNPGHDPDFTWIKNRVRTGTAYNLYMTDKLRGAQLSVYSNNNNIQAGTPEAVKAFNSGGFTVGTDLGVNRDLDDIIAWCWKNEPKFGFEIIPFTGDGIVPRNIPHNLGIPPEWIIQKSLDANNNWVVGSEYLTSWDYYMALNNNSAEVSGVRWGVPTADYFAVTNDTFTNALGQDYITYLFASIPGYSKIGQYIGNGSADGRFVHCGFRPGWVFTKRISGGTSRWQVLDYKRNPYNLAERCLAFDSNDAEVTTDPDIDMFSNGFKLRTSGYNVNGAPYLFMAIAEQPGKYSNAR